MSAHPSDAIADFAIDRAPHDATYWSREETLGRDALRALQEERFRAAIAYGWAKSPWYRRLWGEAGLKPGDVRSLDDITRLPFITKALIRQSQIEAPPYGVMLAEGLGQADIVRIAMTSGTTGKPVLIPFTQRDYSLWMEGVARSLWAAGVRRTDVVHAAFGFTPFVGLFGAHDVAERWIGATVIPGGAWDSAIRTDMIPALGVSVLMGTPTYLLRLGRLAREQGHDLSLWPVKKLFVTGEVGPASSPATGVRLAELWHAEVHEFCGTQETNYFAWDCGHGHFHWNEDLVFPEVLDPVTKAPVPEGEPGELVVTDLMQRTHPLIRFPTGDLVAGFEAVQCTCGRTFRHFKGFIGRIDDVAKIRGVSVAQSGIEHVIRSHPDASDDYDVEFWSDADGLDQVRIRVEPRVPISETQSAVLARALEERLHRTLFVSMRVEIVPQGTLPQFELKAKRIRDNRRRAT
ncbi:phenylacetate--CoA ligase family protein [Xanthobacter pseudotagetidis]|uniref:phenylacetate--CoA ligase family protein n=1 Tax=Xanthobacter pseudotagetidis TaxID=3119911 RepID=UPI00372B7F6F